MIEALVASELWSNLLVQIAGSTVGGLISLAVALLVLRRTKEDNIEVAARLAAKTTAGDLYLAFMRLAGHLVALSSSDALLTPEAQADLDRESTQLGQVLTGAATVLHDRDAALFLVEASLSLTNFLVAVKLTTSDGDLAIPDKISKLSSLLGHFEPWLIQAAMYSQLLGRAKPSERLARPLRFKSSPGIISPQSER